MDRMNEIYSHVKTAMNGTSREVWQCDQSFVEGLTITLL